jgi:hypothetical protein
MALFRQTVCKGWVKGAERDETALRTFWLFAGSLFRQAVVEPKLCV